MFDYLKTIFNNNNINNSNNNESDSKNKNESVNKDENENESENEKEKESESDDEQYYEIKQINNNFKKIDETKSFKDQKEIPCLNDY